MVPDTRSVFERCQRRFPTVDLPLADFAARFEEVLRDSGAPPACGEDLFLAIACARGNPVAWEHFADEFLPALRRVALQACRNPEDAEDLAQELVRTLMADSRKLAGYDGRGSLMSWLRVAISRAAIDRFRQRRRQVPLEDVREEDEIAPQGRLRLSVLPDADGKLDDDWGRVLVGVLAEQIRALPASDRLLLGLYHVEDVPLHRIASQFGVHESTASRWMERLRNTLRKRVEREFRIRHGMRAAEVDALWERAAKETDGTIRAAIGGSTELRGTDSSAGEGS